MENIDIDIDKDYIDIVIDLVILENIDIDMTFLKILISIRRF